jgi:hypothetical protein
MARPADTEETPAVSNSNEPNFLPTDEKYRLTGEMPATEDASAAFKETEQEKEPSATPGDKGDDTTAAASEAADKQREEQREEKGPAQSKSAQTSESRWQKRERELKDARTEIARLKAQGSQPQPQQRSDTQQTSQPASAAAAKTSANPKPKIDDLDPKTNQPKYKTFADYEEAKDSWNRQEAIREFTESSQKSDQARQQSEAERIIEHTVNERVAAVRKQHSDYNDVLTTALAQKDEHGQDAFFYTKGSPIDGFFLDSERGHEVMYEIGKNFEQHQHIFARDAQGKYLLNPVRQVRELAKIENSLPDTPVTAGAGKSGADKTSSSARPITQAARPPHQVSGTGTVAKDSVEQALEDGDFESYQRAQNAKELARLKRK